MGEYQELFDKNQEFKMDGDRGKCVNKSNSGSGGQSSGDADAGASQSSDVTDDEVHALLSTPSGDCANAEKRIIPIGENDKCLETIVYFEKTY